MILCTWCIIILSVLPLRLKHNAFKYMKFSNDWSKILILQCARLTAICHNVLLDRFARTTFVKKVMFFFKLYVLNNILSICHRIISIGYPVYLKFPDCCWDLWIRYATLFIEIFGSEVELPRHCLCTCYFLMMKYLAGMLTYNYIGIHCV